MWVRADAPVCQEATCPAGWEKNGVWEQRRGEQTLSSSAQRQRSSFGRLNPRRQEWNHGARTGPDLSENLHQKQLVSELVCWVCADLSTSVSHSYSVEHQSRIQWSPKFSRVSDFSSWWRFHSWILGNFVLKDKRCGFSLIFEDNLYAMFQQWRLIRFQMKAET